MTWFFSCDFKSHSPDESFSFGCIVGYVPTLHKIRTSLYDIHDALGTALPVLLASFCNQDLPHLCQSLNNVDGPCDRVLCSFAGPLSCLDWAFLHLARSSQPWKPIPDALFPHSLSSDRLIISSLQALRLSCGTRLPGLSSWLSHMYELWNLFFFFLR